MAKKKTNDDKSAKSDAEKKQASIISTQSDVWPDSHSRRLPEQFGRYRIVRLLGHGAMGEVYLARDTQLDRDVALKVPKLENKNQNLLTRFYREARASASLNHPYICPVHDVGEIDGIHYLTMAFIEGKTLAEYLTPGKPNNIRSSVGIVRKLAHGLSEAHKQGILHRDLKPANIMIDAKKQPVVMDFGLATNVGTKESMATQKGAILGTPAYMSPEQVQGKRDIIGPHSDLYGLGIILYQLITGHLPFEGPIAAVLGQILTVEPKRPSELRSSIDPELEAICCKAIAKNIDDRYASTEEFAVALAEWLKIPEAERKRNRLSDSQEMLEVIVEDDNASSDSSGESSTNSLFDFETDVSSNSALERVKRGRRSSKQKKKTPAKQASIWDKIPPNVRWLMAAAGGGAFLILLGVIVFIRTRDNLVKIEVEDDGTVTVKTNVGESSEDKQIVDFTKANPIGPLPPDAVAPFKASEAAAHQQTWAHQLGLKVDATNSIGMELKLIPAGKFEMGAPDNAGPKEKLDPYYRELARPRHLVHITKPFYFGAHEVTQENYLAVVGANPSRHNRSVNYPVDSVSWLEAVSFCNRLSSREKIDPYYKVDGESVSILGGTGYRLPTEAEWEYACRGGTQTRYIHGDEPKGYFDYAWVNKNSGPSVHPVGQKSPNAFGLHDIIGNVSEWCWDWLGAYSRDSNDDSQITDPTGPRTGTARVWRGGGWHWKQDQHMAPWYRGSYNQNHVDPKVIEDMKGFRVVRNIDLGQANEPTTKKFSTANSIPADAKVFNGHSYKVFKEKTIWTNARIRCEEMGGHLVDILNPRENDEVVSMVVDAGLDRVWIGATDESEKGKWTEGEWRWVTDERFIENVTYTNWYSDGKWKEPNDHPKLGQPPGEDYAMMRASRGGVWHDTPNNSDERLTLVLPEGFVCEWDGLPAEVTNKSKSKSSVYQRIRDGQESSQVEVGNVSVDSSEHGTLSAANEKAESGSIKTVVHDFSDESSLDAFEIEGRYQHYANGGLEFKRAVKGGIPGHSRAFTKQHYSLPISLSCRVFCESDGVRDIIPELFGIVRFWWGNGVNRTTELWVSGKKIPLSLHHRRIARRQLHDVEMSIDTERILKITIDGEEICQYIIPRNMRLSGPVTLGGGNGHVIYKEVKIAGNVLPPAKLVESPLTPETILWQDDFSRNRLSEYSNRYPSNPNSWTVANGRLQRNTLSDSPSKTNEWLALPISHEGDFVVDYTVISSVNGVPDTNFRIGGTHFILNFGRRERHAWIRGMHGFDSGSKHGVLAKGQTTKVRVQRIGEEAVMFANGRKIISLKGANISRLVSQLVGIEERPWSAGVAYDDLLVRRPTLKEYEEAGIAPPSEPETPESATQATPKPSVSKAKDEWQPLFNGRDLDGWKTHHDQPGGWRVEEGLLIGDGRNASKHISHLYSEKEFVDFHLRARVRTSDRGNSGVYGRASFGPRWGGKVPHWPNGYEVQIDGNGIDKNKTGTLYLAKTLAKPIRKDLVLPGAWFVLELVVQGNHIIAKIDGQVTADYIDQKDRFKRGRIALQWHTDRTFVEFEKIEIKDLSSSDSS